MVQKKAQVSPGCRAVMDREHAAATSRKREADGAVETSHT